VDFSVVPVGDEVVLDRIPVLDVALHEEKAAHVGHNHPGRCEHRNGKHGSCLEEGKGRLLDEPEAALRCLDGGIDRVGDPAVVCGRVRVAGWNTVGGRLGLDVGKGVLGGDDDLFLLGLAEAVVVGLVSFPVELGVPLVFANVRLAECDLEVAVEVVVGADRQARTRRRARSLAGSEPGSQGLVRQLKSLARS